MNTKVCIDCGSTTSRANTWYYRVKGDPSSGMRCLKCYNIEYNKRPEVRKRSNDWMRMYRRENLNRVKTAQKAWYYKTRGRELLKRKQERMANLDDARRYGREQQASYRKTFKGSIVIKYNTLRVNALKNKTKLGFFLTRDAFYNWLLNDRTYSQLFKQWEEANYDTLSAPTIIRKDFSKGYELDNLTIITKKESPRFYIDNR